MVMLMERVGELEDGLNAIMARQVAMAAELARTTAEYKAMKDLVADLGRGSIWSALNTGMTSEEFRDKIAEKIAAAAARHEGSMPGFECVVLATRLGTTSHTVPVFRSGDSRTLSFKAPPSNDASAWMEAMAAVRSAAPTMKLIFSRPDASDKIMGDCFEQLVRGDDHIWTGWMDRAQAGRMLWERGVVGKAAIDNGGGHQPLSPWARQRIGRWEPVWNARTRIMRDVSWELTDEPSLAGWTGDEYEDEPPLMTPAQQSTELSAEDMRIVVDIHPSGKEQVLIVVRPPNTTVIGVLSAIHTFYHTPRTMQDFLQLQQNDSWNFVQQAIDHMRAGKGPRAYVDIMGGRNYFKGLCHARSAMCSIERCSG
jgi:hypothetical protein